MFPISWVPLVQSANIRDRIKVKNVEHFLSNYLVSLSPRVFFCMSLTCVTKCFVLTIFYTWFSNNLIQLNHAGGVFYDEVKAQYIFNLGRIWVLQNKFCFMEGKVDRFNQPCSNSIVPAELFQFRAVYEVAVPICFSGYSARHSCIPSPKKGGVNYVKY